MSEGPISVDAISAAPTGEQGNPFNPRTVLAFIVVGFAAFILLLYFLAIDDTGDKGGNGAAHAAANGLNGYSALVDLLQKEGIDARVSRSQSDLETYDLLVLTPPSYTDPEEFGALLEERQFQGPTLIILPKWYASGFPQVLPDEIEDKVKRGWVRLSSADQPSWTKDLPEPFAFEVTGEELDDGAVPDFSGYERSAELPTRTINYAEDKETNRTLVQDGADHALAISVWGEEGSDFYDSGYAMVFVVEPDLMNNYGMADEQRAKIALELFEDTLFQDDPSVVFDLTLNGIGSSTNLLTLAFRPPFLAATLCLIALMVVIGWRAFKRFGPPVAQGPAIAFGKQRLVTNGAGLIMRAKRYELLAEPYIEISAQRVRNVLGLAGRDDEKLDAAVQQRLPNELDFTQRANDLRSAQSQSDILRAAQALKDLERNLQQ